VGVAVDTRVSSMSTRSFAEIAAELSLMDGDSARRLVEQALQQSISPVQLAQQQGQITAVQADIVDTLLRPRDTIPGYEILSVVGQGGMGVVFRARQLNLDRWVALKTVLVNRRADAKVLARFEQEAVAVARLQHPHIVAAYDFGQHAGRLFFAMEWLDGEDAESYIRKRGKLDEITAWSLVRQAAAGLAHAAEMAIVHRDIKPANLLFVAAPAGYPIAPGLPMVKITDFGIAYLAHTTEQDTRLTADGTVVGSPNYLAPEQLEDRPVDHRTDMYALGATAFQMLTGKPPFSNKSLAQIIAAKLDGQGLVAAEPHVELSSASTEMLRWLMARDPNRRPKDYQELIKSIDALIGAQSGSTSAHGRAPAQNATADLTTAQADTLSFRSADSIELHQPARSRHRPRWMAATLFLCGVVTLVVAGYRLLLYQPDARSMRRRDLVATGWEKPLFDGRSVGFRRGLNGVWKQGKDDEGASILIGENGLLPFELPSVREGQRQPPLHYRISLQVQLPQAQRVEVRFGISRDNDRFHAIRIESSSIAAGVADASGAWKENSRKAATEMREKFHVVQIERQPDAWWILWDEAPLVVMPYAEELYRPEFQLQVVGGAAWFSDLMLEELGRPE
jgi:serine/threonine protein kinase